jgi:hypothetical protein
MNITYIMKDKSDEYLASIMDKPAKEAHEYLNAQANSAYAYNIKQKIGNGSFRDKVELNQLLRKPNVQISHSIAPRKGYKLITVIVN